MNDDIKIKPEDVRVDCIHFEGYRPCTYHRKYGVNCLNCSYYKKVNKKILILKLGASGEVLRNTPLLRRIKKEYPNSRIFWLTQYPDLVPSDEIFRVYNFSERELELIKDVEFDILYSLDKHEETGALANQIRARVKKGFSQKEGVIIPFDKDAEKKWMYGINDYLMKENEKHYVEEIFEICGFDFNGEEYMLPDYTIPDVRIDKNKKIIALNTGAGKGWPLRIYSEKNWIKLAEDLLNKGYEVIITGGEKEDDKNKRIAAISGAKYFGFFNLKEFIGLLSLADVVVTSVTFGLHAAIGLKKKIILLNNVFNKKEFYMYERGIVLEPDVPCLACYQTAENDSAYVEGKCCVKNCLDKIETEKIVDEVEKMLKENPTDKIESSQEKRAFIRS